MSNDTRNRPDAPPETIVLMRRIEELENILVEFKKSAKDSTELEMINKNSSFQLENVIFT